MGSSLGRDILLVSFLSPSSLHAGGLRLLDLYSEIKKINFKGRLILVTSDGACESENRISEIFDEIYMLERFDKKELLNMLKLHSRYDVVDLQYHQSGQFIEIFREKYPRAKIIFSPMESQVRVKKIWSHEHSFFAKFSYLFLRISWNAFWEKRYVKKSDCTVLVSEADKEALMRGGYTEEVMALPTCLSDLEFSPSRLNNFHYDENSLTVVFFAYFGSRTNEEALLWFCQKVHPIIHKAIKNYKFSIVGKGLSEKLIRRCLNMDSIEYIGPVESAIDGLRNAAIGIAPALSGAGVRGKIHQYSVLGIPCVASPIACESLTYKDHESIVVADDALDFANACISLLRDVSMRKRIGCEARNVCLSTYTWNSQAENIKLAYAI